VYQATYTQIYREQGHEVTCWWAISGDEVSYFVIDVTRGLSEAASFLLEGGTEGNRGILRTSDGSRCIDQTKSVFYITGSGVREELLCLSARQLTHYLESGTHPLTIEGIRLYEREHAA